MESSKNYETHTNIYSKRRLFRYRNEIERKHKPPHQLIVKIILKSKIFPKNVPFMR